MKENNPMNEYKLTGRYLTCLLVAAFIAGISATIILAATVPDEIGKEHVWIFSFLLLGQGISIFNILKQAKVPKSSDPT